MLGGNLCSGWGQEKSQQAAPPCCLLHSSLPYFLPLFLLSHTLEGSTKAPTRFSTFQSRQSPTHLYSSRFYNTCSVTEATTMLHRGSFHLKPLQTDVHLPCVLSDNATEFWTQDCVCLCTSTVFMSMWVLELITLISLRLYSVCVTTPSITLETLSLFCFFNISTVREVVQATTQAHTLTTAV